MKVEEEQGMETLQHEPVLCLAGLQEGPASVLSHPACLRLCHAPQYYNGKQGLGDESRTRNSVGHKYDSSGASKTRYFSAFLCC